MSRVGNSLVLAAAAAALLCTSPASAEEKWPEEVRIAVLKHDVAMPKNLDYENEHGYDIGAEILFPLREPDWFLDGWSLRPNVGFTVNTKKKGTNKIYAGVILEYSTPISSSVSFFGNIGVGGALHDGKIDTDDQTRKSLGSRALFRLPFELGITIADRHSLSLMWDHISNANLGTTNPGLDAVGFRYGYKF